MELLKGKFYKYMIEEVGLAASIRYSGLLTLEKISGFRVQMLSQIRGVKQWDSSSWVWAEGPRAVGGEGPEGCIQVYKGWICGGMFVREDDVMLDGVRKEGFV